MNFTTYPVLTTERLSLRHLLTGYKQDIFALRSDPEINRYLDQQVCTTIDEALHFIYKVHDNVEQKITLYWAITLTDSETFAGTICLFDFSSQKNSCEIRYELMTKFQGRGLMKETAQVVMDYAFQSFCLSHIPACTQGQNLNSSKLLTKFNFVISPEPDPVNPNLNVFTLTQKH